MTDMTQKTHIKVAVKLSDISVKVSVLGKLSVKVSTLMLKAVVLVHGFSNLPFDMRFVQTLVFLRDRTSYNYHIFPTLKVKFFITI